MTPQERDLVAALFERLAGLEAQPRDPEAERLMTQGLTRAPHAIYPLVQTVLLQEEALKRANARIEELEAKNTTEPQAPAGGFLDNMRGALFGRAPAESGDARGSVPSVRPSGVWNTGQAGAAPPPPAVSTGPRPSHGGTDGWRLVSGHRGRSRGWNNWRQSSVQWHPQSHGRRSPGGFRQLQ